MKQEIPLGEHHRFESFLRKHPSGMLTVAVGYASILGIAWLSDRTNGRPVTLLIGNARKRYYKNASEADRRKALRFLERNDVKVRCWYRKRPKPAEAHLKVWVAYTGRGEAVLVGSANLTGAGLFRNWEMVVEPSDADTVRVVREVRNLERQALDAKERLLGYIRSNGGVVEKPRQAVSPRYAPHPSPVPPQRPRRPVKPQRPRRPAPAPPSCYTPAYKRPLTWPYLIPAVLLVAAIVWCGSA